MYYGVISKRLSESFILIWSAIFGAILTWLHVSDYRSLTLNNCFNVTNISEMASKTVLRSRCFVFVFVFVIVLFCFEAQNLLHFEPCDFVQILKVCGTNILF